MKRVLITGAAGFIGSHLAERLLDRGDTVAGLDEFNDYYNPAIKRANVAEALKNERYTLHETDICDEPGLRAVFEAERPEVVVHLAARAGVRPSVENPNLYHRVNVIGGQHILDACRDFKVDNLVFASSSSVYGGSTDVPFRETDPVARPVSPYAATKRMNELQAHVYSHLYGLNVTMLRFFTVYGPRQRPDMAIHKFTRLILEGRPVPMFGDGSTRRDYTYIEDILDGLVRCVDTPFRYEIFNLGEHHTTSLRDLIEMIARHCGKEAIIEPRPLQPGDVSITFADIDHARALLGYAPKFSMDEGVGRFVEWYKRQKAER
ncbi:MAG TPA: GDP-mannose 4,6-dehydratase [Candidatus Hydrogenedentes bacterium]|nr:GDP-mannose 4,6-dehydratase [Candidatus Hydrogenedentota bacterium]HOV72412.1 GDP-mannose 4,6-dehydratase [Candidatus Hydrogenedentota bacterium]HPC16608.1 GDP-mannose 4,6-dehydratase [Candidatus Hydrogenedentota bacterium]HRT20936.1 GDP-mannose 4,6-dehydratase [Candidatus Hydrogenedentota bacterium]HRT63459.1 GDP-mannose 4,6-dehydratase [Candidatus Hydrogenedentota bacterium]